MWFFCFLIGNMIGFALCAIFSGVQYEKGYRDGFKNGEIIGRKLEKWEHLEH